MKTYRVEIGFGGYIGATKEYEVEADSREEAEEIAMQWATDDLVIEDVEEGDEENGENEE